MLVWMMGRNTGTEVGKVCSVYNLDQKVFCEVKALSRVRGEADYSYM